MSATAYVPKGSGTDKDGKPLEYGGYPVTLETCPLDGNVYADLEQHAGTPAHKAAKG